MDERSSYTNPTKNGEKLRCSGRVATFCFMHVIYIDGENKLQTINHVDKKMPLEMGY